MRDFEPLGFPSREMFEFPNIVNIEVYRGNCFCSCPHCPVGATEASARRERFGHKGFDLDLYRKIISEISLHSHSTVRIHSVGEPIMWNGLEEALSFTKEKSVRSWIFTCAVTSDTSLLEAVCANTDLIEVSVNSANPKDYLATKGVDAFELVAKNIRHMHEYIKSGGLTSRLIASRVESSDNEADLEFVKYWKQSGLVDDAFVRSYHTYNDLLPQLEPTSDTKKHKACLVHWGRFNISVDGQAVMCFNELFKEQLNPSLIMGDLREQKISEIWHGQKYAALRKAELSGDYSELSFAGILPCKDCYSCQPLHGNRQTSEYQIKQMGGGSA